MFSTKDYTTVTLDELVSEEKKLKSQKIPTALIMGFLVGIAIWSTTHEGSAAFTFGLLLFVPLIGSRYQRKLKGIQTEINSRNPVNKSLCGVHLPLTGITRRVQRGSPTDKGCKGCHACAF